MPTTHRILDDGQVLFTVTEVHRLDFDDAVAMLDDIVADLDLELDGETALVDWLNARRADAGQTPMAYRPNLIRTGRAAEAIADIVAAHIAQADDDALESAMQHMMTDDGWRFEQHALTLWLECSDEHDTVVVWLGNLVDYDMTDLGRAHIAF